MDNIIVKWFDGYGPHDAMYIAVLVFTICFFLYGHLKDEINIWELVTTTDKTGKKRTDPRKLMEFSAFLVMTYGFSYLIITNHLSDWYALTYVAAFVAARTARDFAQLKDKALSMKQETETK
jgi:hypothetical protein